MNWMKLDELKHRVNKFGAIGATKHRQSGKMVNFNLDETKENLELELSAILSRIGIDKNSTGVATVATGVSTVRSSQLASDASGCLL